MIRDINFTGRHSLDNCYRIVARKGPAFDPHWTVDVELVAEELQKFDLPETFVCWVEVYYGSRQQRFKMGDGELKNKWKDSFKTEMSNEIYFKMRLKIVSSDDPEHKILASKRTIIPETVDMNGNKEPLLPVKYDTTLGSIPWSLKLDEEQNQARPVLYVNCDLHRNDEDSPEDIVKREPLFAALVLPEAMRQILTHKIVNEEDVDPGDPWIKFIGDIAKPEVINSKDIIGRREIVDAAVESFCASHHLLDIDKE